MNPLGKALNKVLNPSVENATTTFSNNYNGKDISFEGFFGDMFKRIFKNKQWKEEKKIEAGDWSLDIDINNDSSKSTDELSLLFKRTLLNSTWTKKNPGREVVVSNKTFKLAFLFMDGDVIKGISEYFKFLNTLNSKMKSIVNEVQKVEQEIVDTAQKKYEVDQDIGDVTEYTFNASEMMFEVWKKQLKNFKVKYKDLFEVTFYVTKSKESISYNVNWLKDLEVTIAPEQIIEFVKYLDKNGMYAPHSFGVTEGFGDIFDGGPNKDDDDVIWEDECGFYHDSHLFTFNESIYGNLINSNFEEDVYMYRSKNGNSLALVVDKMFGAGDGK